MGGSCSHAADAWGNLATQEDIRDAVRSIEVWQKAQEQNRVTGHRTTSTGPLLQRVGGLDVVKQVVELFYRKLYLDERLLVFLHDHDIVYLRAKQTLFMTWLFGPPNEPYLGRNVRVAHLRLIKQRGFSPEDFDLGMEYFEQAMREMEAPQAIINEVMSKVRPFKTAIFTPSDRDADEEARWIVEERAKQQQAAGEEQQQTDSGKMTPLEGLAPRATDGAGSGSRQGPQCPFTSGRLSRPPSAGTASATGIRISGEILTPAPPPPPALAPPPVPQSVPATSSASNSSPAICKDGAEAPAAAALAAAAPAAVADVPVAAAAAAAVVTAGGSGDANASVRAQQPRASESGSTRSSATPKPQTPEAGCRPASVAAPTMLQPSSSGPRPVSAAPRSQTPETEPRPVSAAAQPLAQDVDIRPASTAPSPSQPSRPASVALPPPQPTSRPTSVALPPPQPTSRPASVALPPPQPASRPVSVAPPPPQPTSRPASVALPPPQSTSRPASVALPPPQPPVIPPSAIPQPQPVKAASRPPSSIPQPPPNKPASRPVSAIPQPPLSAALKTHGSKVGSKPGSSSAAPPAAPSSDPFTALCDLAGLAFSASQVGGGSITAGAVSPASVDALVELAKGPGSAAGGASFSDRPCAESAEFAGSWSAELTAAALQLSAGEGEGTAAVVVQATTGRSDSARTKTPSKGTDDVSAAGGELKRPALLALEMAVEMGLAEPEDAGGGGKSANDDDTTAGTAGVEIVDEFLTEMLEMEEKGKAAAPSVAG